MDGRLGGIRFHRSCHLSLILDFRLLHLQLTAEISTIWKSYKPLAFGDHAIARLENVARYSVVKIAHPSDRRQMPPARRRIHYHA
jgi:hypothetical protein